jgi:hypothetical protein
MLVFSRIDEGGRGRRPGERDMTDERKCARCGAVNAAEARFCSSCGAPLVAAAPPPPPPPPSSASFSSSRASGFASGPARTLTVAMDPAQAFAAFQQAGIALGGAVAEDAPPNRIKFSIPYKDRWTTIGFTVKLDCEVQIAPDPAGARVTVSTGLNLTSAIPVFLIYVAIGLLLIGYGFVLGVAIDVWVFYKLNGETSEKATAALIERATAAAAG